MTDQSLNIPYSHYIISISSFITARTENKPDLITVTICTCFCSAYGLIEAVLTPASKIHQHQHLYQDVQYSHFCFSLTGATAFLRLGKKEYSKTMLKQ